MAEQAANTSSRPPSLFAQASSRNTAPAPPSATLQSPPTPITAMSNPRPASRPSSGPEALQSPHMSLPPGSAPRSASNMQPFHPPLVAPNVPLSTYPDFGHSHPSLPGLSNLSSHSQMSTISVQGQKRAYRQRRKDPSCDACRERKVKCDATDSSSCTECSSRNVKCQFTKETNRRMSNIRHNQDLQKELDQARSQVSQLRSMLDTPNGESPLHHSPPPHLPVPGPSHNHNLPYLPEPETPQHSVEQFPDYEERSSKRRKISGHLDLAKIGSNMERHGRGIFKPPYPRQQFKSPILSSTLLKLPPKPVADTLLRQYHFTFHSTLPMIHWPSFKERYEAVYKSGSLESVPRIWSALLFAVFACGTLHRSWQDGQRYLDESRSLVDTWTEELTVDHVRAAVLSSIFLIERNLKSAGWTWIGFAVRMAVDIGLHCEAGTWPAIEEEMRRRVWWCVYACDCLLSLELGRPPLIKEEDCNVSLPSPADDQYIIQSNDWTSPTPEQSTSFLRPMIQVIGGIAKLLKMLKGPCMTEHTIQIYDVHFVDCMQGFPAQQQVRANDYIDPIELPAMMYLQNARLMLKRHNLSPTCEIQARSAAIDHCTSVALDTATLLRRCLQDPPSSSQLPLTEQNDTWQKRMVSAASSFFCTHIWRCTLFLCFRMEFENALCCARASASMGNVRPVNVACGQYLEFFLQEIISKTRQGVSFGNDEEMIAYVSGDLQGSFETSWIWQPTKGEVHIGSPLYASNTEGEIIVPGVAKIGSDAEAGEWTGWNNVLRTLEQLLHDQQQEQQSRALHESTLRPPLMLPPLAPSSSPGNHSNRMRIKDLI